MIHFIMGSTKLTMTLNKAKGHTSTVSPYAGANASMPR